MPSLFPAGTDVIQKSVEMVLGITPFPDVINLRKLENGAAGTMNQGRFALDKMLLLRGDPRVKSVVDLSIDFDDFDQRRRHDRAPELLRDQRQYGCGRAEDPTGRDARRGRSRHGVWPHARHAGRGESPLHHAVRSARSWRASWPTTTSTRSSIPTRRFLPPILVGTVDSIPWLNYDGRPARGYNAFTDASGLPDIGVPAGFTSVVYDRTTRGSSEALALDPPAVKRDVTLPFNVQFLGRPWSEPVLLEIAAAYETARGPRIPPPDFGPLAGEP